MKVILRTTLALFSIISFLEASPPAVVAERLNGAENALESGHFVGSYSVDVKSVVAKENGSSRKTTDMEMAVEVDGVGKERWHLVHFIEDGKDTTEKNRKDLESDFEDDEDDDADEEEDEDFLVPFGPEASRFVFGPATKVGEHMEMTFEPARDHEGDNGITRGTMAWNESSLDPLWVDMEVLEPEKPLREFKVRMEFKRAGEQVYLSRMVTDGRVKILLLKRNFRMEMVIRDIKTAG